ncbi:MAG: hypothetical protein QOH06_12 [Acidobacteriota bacterium]|jgi:hypothetical protein|nr:hypothetical protein [Acidobacteriota bacterium]
MRRTIIFVALAAALAAAGRPTLVDHAWFLFASMWGESCASQPGGCIVTPQTDEGLGMDPNGKPGS